MQKGAIVSWHHKECKVYSVGHVMYEFAYPVQRLGLWGNKGTCAFGNLGHSPASQFETAAWLNAPNHFAEECLSSLMIIPCHICSLSYNHLYLLWASTLDKSLSPA